MDDSDIKHHDIVPGAAISLDVWYTWKTLIQSAAVGESDKVCNIRSLLPTSVPLVY